MEPLTGAHNNNMLKDDTMYFLPNKLALACAIALSLTACNDNSSSTPADPVATKATLMQTMDKALRESQALDPYGFAIDASSIAQRKALDSSLLKQLDTIDPSLLEAVVIRR